MMKTAFRIVPLIFAALIVIFVSIVSLSPNSTELIDENLTVATLVATQESSVIEYSGGINNIPFQDNPEVYKDDDPSSVVTMYVTITAGEDDDWNKINEIVNIADVNNQVSSSGKAEIIVQFGDETGPLPSELGYNVISPNATIEARGANTASDPQKSYRITLYNNAGVWRGQSIINLNKHLSDETRFRNKLSFDLMKQVPGLVSLRTQFVHLYVRIESADQTQSAYVDYGLYTQVEQPNKRYLESRLLDKDGQLYKANNFLFNVYPEQIRLVTDPLYDEAAFSEVLDIRGSNDHAKLIQMLKDVNNEDVPIEQTFEAYFDAENYFTWMAFNLLTGNVDVVSQNYLLYSPKNGNKWYFISWDYDRAFPLQTNRDLSTKYYFPWQKGLSAYWPSTLHRRVLEVGEYKDALDAKMDELLDILYPNAIDDLINFYQPVIERYSFAMPDLYNLPVQRETSIQIADLISSDVDNNYSLYVKSLEEPMPFSLKAPILNSDMLSFSWTNSYDLGSRPFSYRFILGRDWAFNEIVLKQDLTDTFIDIPVELLSPGKYFWQVTALNSLGGVQYPYDFYVDIDSVVHPGVKMFYFTLDGRVIE